MERIFGLLTIVCALLAGMDVARAEERVTIFAAASLRGALEAALASVEVATVVSYGGSGAMARQVSQGAPADLVILANSEWMDWLEDRGQLADGHRSDLLGNRLVVVGPEGSKPLSANDAEAFLTRLDGGRLAVGHTRAVPAGIYARDWMQASGLWEGLRPHLAETENVRAALALVARGEAPLGIVYSSDAQADPAVQVLAQIDAEWHAPIVYPIAVVAGRESDAARAVLAHLKGDAAAQAFVDHGFSLAGGPS